MIHRDTVSKNLWKLHKTFLCFSNHSYILLQGIYDFTLYFFIYAEKWTFTCQDQTISPFISKVSAKQLNLKHTQCPLHAASYTS